MFSGLVVKALDDAQQDKESWITEEWEAFLGLQIRTLRIRADLEQAELAAKAHISTGAIKNIEGGKGSSLKTLIKVLRILGREDWLEALAPQASESSIAMQKSASRSNERKRVFRPRTAKNQEKKTLPSFDGIEVIVPSDSL